MLVSDSISYILLNSSFSDFGDCNDSVLLIFLGVFGGHLKYSTLRKYKAYGDDMKDPNM